MKKVILIISVIFMISLIIILNVPIKWEQTEFSNFQPLKVEGIAKKFAPVFYVENEDFKKPVKLYYRASKDEYDNIYIAYHPVWKEEINNEKGLIPMLNRIIYTGGLGIQEIMFGKGDVESIEIVIDKNSKVKQIVYETVDQYNPKQFSVKHKKISVTDPNIKNTAVFKVISWNHLFKFLGEADGTLNEEYKSEKNKFCKLVPQYFTEDLWKEYEMTKRYETLIKRNRAHFEYEKEYVE